MVGVASFVRGPVGRAGDRNGRAAVSTAKAAVSVVVLPARVGGGDDDGVRPVGQSAGGVGPGAGGVGGDRDGRSAVDDELDGAGEDVGGAGDGRGGVVGAGAVGRGGDGDDRGGGVDGEGGGVAGRVAGGVGGGDDDGVRAVGQGRAGCRSRRPAASVVTVTGAPPSMTSWMVPERTSEVPVMAGVESLVVDPSAGAVIAMAGATVSTVKATVSVVRVAGRVGGGGDDRVRTVGQGRRGCRSSRRRRRSAR